MTTLTGITWNHYARVRAHGRDGAAFWRDASRGGNPLEKRSLQEFADAPVEKLAERFDLLVIDHPSVAQRLGMARCFPWMNIYLKSSWRIRRAIPLVPRMPATTITATNGRWRTDAATPVSAWRPDRLTQPPRTWAELIELARTKCSPYRLSHRIV